MARHSSFASLPYQCLCNALYAASAPSLVHMLTRHLCAGNSDDPEPIEGGEHRFVYCAGHGGAHRQTGGS